MQIGFSEYEAKVYRALLAEYPASGYQVSKSSGVPRSMVYEVLNRLKKRGAVLEAIEGRVTLFSPLPPSSLLDKHEDDLQRLIDGLRPGLEELYQSKRDERTWAIYGRDSVMVYAAQMIRQAQREVYLVVNDENLEALRAELQAADGRGVPVSALLTGAGELSVGNVTRHPPLESKLHGLTDTLLVIVDGAEVLISNPGSETSATITNNKNIILIAHQFVWMEFFTQRVYSKLGDELLQRLDEQDRQIFES